MEYDTPMDIVNFLNEKKISGYCNVLIRTIKELDKNNKNTGLITVVKNEDYGFLVIDYGVMIFALQKYVKNYFLAKRDNEKGEQIAAKIYDDFLVDKEENLSKNGKFFVNVLEYYKLGFLSKNKKSFYTRVLYKDNKTNNLSFLNTISINKKALESIVSKNKYNENIISIINDNDVKIIAYDKQISNILKAVEGSVKVNRIWSRESGLNMNYFNSNG